MQPFAEQHDVFGRIVGISEVREKEPRRFALQDGGEGSIPDPQIDVWRRSGGAAEGGSLPAPPPRLARGGPALPLVQTTALGGGRARLSGHLPFLPSAPPRFLPPPP